MTHDETLSLPMTTARSVDRSSAVAPWSGRPFYQPTTLGCGVVAG